MDKLTAIRAFVTVVEQHGFAAAGRALGISRAAVSRHIQALEDDLGVRLFNRSTRTVSITETGRAYLARVSPLIGDLDEADQLVSLAASEPRGVLKVNAPMSFGTMHLAKTVAGFMACYGDIEVVLVLNDRFIDPYEDGFDVTVRIADLADSDLIARKIAVSRRVLCASPGYLARHGVPETPADLRRHAVLHYDTRSGHGGAHRGPGNPHVTWHLRGADGAQRATVAPRLVSNNGEVLREAALEGHGIADLPTFITGEALKSGRLIPVLEAFHLPASAIHAIYPPNRYLAAKVRLFIDYLAQAYAVPPWDAVCPGDRPSVQALP